MKNLPVQITALLTLGVLLHAQRTAVDYDGILDDTYWSNTSDYWIANLTTRLSQFARYSDVIGIGKVSDMQTVPYTTRFGHIIPRRHFTVTVDDALVGCTNGQPIMVRVNYTDIHMDELHDTKISDYLPTNDSRIVFAVSSNDYGNIRGVMFWNHPALYFPSPEKVYTEYQLYGLNRSWWPPERDGGELFNHFTNLIHVLRVEHNWTNYYHLMRDATNSPSARVREDSFWAMRGLALFASDEEKQFMLDDPLVDSKHKECLLVPGWRAGGR